MFTIIFACFRTIPHADGPSAKAWHRRLGHVNSVRFDRQYLANRQTKNQIWDPLRSARIFSDPPVSSGAVPILNSSNGTLFFHVKIGNLIMCNSNIQKPIDAERCPRFHTCNASHCPLSGEGLHLPGEKICYYLLNSGKAGAVERFRDDPVFAECVSKLPQTAAKFSEIDRSVGRAAKTGFQGQNITRTPTQSDFGVSVTT